MHTCPVCGFGMEVPLKDYNICSCCGTEFDRYVMHEQLRREWIDAGMKWWSIYNTAPDGWNPVEQLKKVTA